MFLSLQKVQQTRRLFQARKVVEPWVGLLEK